MIDYLILAGSFCILLGCQIMVVEVKKLWIGCIKDSKGMDDVMNSQTLVTF